MNDHDPDEIKRRIIVLFAVAVVVMVIYLTIIAIILYQTGQAVRQ